MPTLKEIREQNAEIARLQAAVDEAEAAGLVAMRNVAGETINVAPDSVTDHERLGWRVIE